MGLLIAAGFTTAIALVGFALLLIKCADRHSAALAFLVALPLQPLAFYALRMPIDGALKGVFGTSLWMIILAQFYAPLTEEPAKWLTALVPTVRDAIRKQPVTMALVVGLGFGIGELWFIAHALTSRPDFPDLPATAFGGFVIERLEVCFLHGAFVALPFARLARGGVFWLGGLAGMALHFLLNFPILLAGLNVFGLGSAWAAVLQLWVLAFVVGCAAMTWWLARGATTGATA
jgi:hypothetical protein